MHLVVFMHGLLGSATDLIALQQRISSDVTIHVHSIANCHNTLAGIEHASAVVTHELIALLHANLHFVAISFIAHSLGGLIIRHALSALHEKLLFQRLRKYAFISLSSPHLATAHHMPSWLPHWVRCQFSIALAALGMQTALELLLLDGRTPLIERMAKNDCFIAPLQEFEHLVTYANSHNDLAVPFYSSSITGAADTLLPGNSAHISTIAFNATAHKSLSPLHRLNWQRLRVKDLRWWNGHCKVFETAEFCAEAAQYLACYALEPTQFNSHQIAICNNTLFIQTSALLSRKGHE